MHRCLLIAEVVDDIFHYFDTQSLDSRRTLIALVETCKSFTEPALDALWREQYTLDNVLKCLPRDSWCLGAQKKPKPFSTPESRTTLQNIIRTLEPDDWRMVSKFLPRVRSLELDGHSAHPLASLPKQNALDAISSRFTFPDRIFPNLKKLRWFVPRAHFSSACLFLGPRILELAISTLEMDAEKLATLVSLSELVSLECYSMSSKLVMQTRCARTLDLKTIDRAALEHISTLPGLQHVVLQGPTLGDCGSALEPLSLHHTRFPSLNSLELWNTQIDFLAEIFAIIRTVFSLREIIVHPRIATPKTSIHHILELIASHVNPTTLEKLEIGDPLSDMPNQIRYPPHTDPYVVDGAALLPLCCFSNFTTLIIQPPVGFTIDDAIIWRLASGWPKLAHLHLSSDAEECFHFQVEPTTTLDALRALAKHCPMLETINMPFTTIIVPSFAARPISQGSLTTINFNQSPILNPARVAAFLAAVFPNLRHITTTYESRLQMWGEFEGDSFGLDDDDPEMVTTEEYLAKWKEVERIHASWMSARHEAQDTA
ncbi:hypothetical protein C8F01DRAFT_1143083 [Mycena amicta]|nr:hypothetical protein C8F01DRAFT_1143083 [Mycena amicta]